MSWFKKLLPTKIGAESDKKGVPEGVWSKCEQCNAMLYNADLGRNCDVCPKCDHHIYVTARKRLDLFLDEDHRSEIATDVKPRDILKFKDSKKYKDRISAAQKKTGETDALVVIQGKVNGLNVVACAFEFGFIGGSMGAAVGERFVQGINQALASRSPFVCFTTSGGARMQEGIVSLMQMAKTSAALSKLSAAKIPYISVLTNPTMGGVSASLAMLGDVIVAEPKALIGFAGPRVIEQTVRETLPEGFQRSEFLLDHGAIDMIIDRREMKTRLSHIIAKLTKQNVTHNTN